MDCGTDIADNSQGYPRYPCHPRFRFLLRTAPECYSCGFGLDL